MSSLLQTIVTDLSAGESWLAQEAQDAGLFLWNTLKSAFIALGPVEGQILSSVLTNAVIQAGSGASIEQIYTSALNTTVQQEQAVLIKAGTGVAQTVIAGIKANLAAGVPTAAPAAPIAAKG